MDKKFTSFALLFSLFFFVLSKLHQSHLLMATTNALQNLVVTVPTTIDLKVNDPSLEVTFDPMLARNGVQELVFSSGYQIVNIGALRMITSNISEELQGIDFFVYLSPPSGTTGGSIPSSRGEIKLNSTDQPVVSGVGNCMGYGEINYRAVATFANIPEGSFSQKVIVVSFTLVPST